MSEMIFQEVDFFIASFLWGIFLLVVYDGLRIFRRTLIHSKGAVALEDMLFWLVSGLLVFRMMYEKNDGTIRGTAFLSIGLGMVIYHYAVSPYIVKWGYNLIGKPIKKICSIFHKGLKKIKKTVKLLLKKTQNQKEKEGQHDKETKRSTKRS